MSESRRTPICKAAGSGLRLLQPPKDAAPGAAMSSVQTQRQAEGKAVQTDHEAYEKQPKSKKTSGTVL